MRQVEGLVWFDGRWVGSAEAVLSIADPALGAGLGVFETLAVRQGEVLDWQAHWRRFLGAAAALGVAVRDEAEVARAAARLASHVCGGAGWLKLLALRPAHCAVFGGTMDPAEEGRPATAVLLPWYLASRGPLAGLKTLNYAAFALGLEEARRRGADEGLWRNERGHLTEGCTSNLFLVRRRKVYTAGLREGILPGVTRAIAMAAARRLGLAVWEGKLRLKRLLEADEAFLTSSLRGVRPLLRVDQRPVGSGRPGPVTEAIAREVVRLRERGIPLRPVASRAGSDPAGGIGK